MFPKPTCGKKARLAAHRSFDNVCARNFEDHFAIFADKFICFFDELNSLKMILGHLRWLVHRLVHAHFQIFQNVFQRILAVVDLISLVK